LLAFLAMRRTPVVERDVVAEALWPDIDLYTGRNRLKAILSIVKSEVEGLPIITHGKHYLELSREQVVVDYQLCERRLKWRRSLTGRDRIAFAKQLFELTSNGLLPDLGAVWALAERERYVALSREFEQDLKDGDPNVKAGFRLGDDLGGVEVPLIGRDDELRQIEAWLSGSGSHRELHIVGTPGVGKTRLLKAALAAASDFCDATISLSTVQTSEVPWLERLGQVLGIQKAGGVAMGLARLLADFRYPLLVLDDLDQASPEMREWVDGIMMSIPHLKLIGAARRRPQKPTVEICDLKAFSAGSDDATALLVSFARHFGAKISDIAEDRAALGQIADNLDGLPLALEIAAAWLPIVEPLSLCRKLRSSPELITNRAGAGRGSLVDCVSAICNDLTPEDARALLCLSLCRGGCGEALAEEMLGSDWPWRVGTLVDRSLALRVDGQAGNRFLVVQALREAVRLVQGSERVEKAQQIWRDACLALGKRVFFDVNEGDRKKWLNWLRDEGENIVAACLTGLGDDSALAEGIEVLNGLRASFGLIGQYSKYRQALGDLVARGNEVFPENGASTPTPLIEFRADVLSSDGKHADAIRMTASHRTALETGTDKWRLARALDNEGDARDMAADYEGSVECWNRCSKLFEEAGYPRHALWIQCKIAGTEILAGRFAEALARKQRTLERARQVGDENSIGMYLKEFAADALENREFDEARRLAEAAVDAFRKTGESTTLSYALIVLAATHLASNDLAAAAAALREAQMLDPTPNAQYGERFATLMAYVNGGFPGRTIYDHLTVDL